MRTQLNLENYYNNGIDWPVRAIAEPEAAVLYQRFLDFRQYAKKARGRETHIKPHLISTLLDSIVHHPVVVDAVEQAIGPDIVLWSSDIASKEAGKGTYVPWHQDTPYWNLSSHEVVTVWLALTPAKVYNGAMQVILGTHKAGGWGVCF